MTRTELDAFDRELVPGPPNARRLVHRWHDRQRASDVRALRFAAPPIIDRARWRAYFRRFREAGGADRGVGFGGRL